MRGSLLLVFCGLLGACSNTFIYNLLDWLIPWYVGDYVDLTREQKKSFKEQLRPLLEWHRGEELRNYLAFIDRVEGDLGQPLTAGTISAWSQEFVLAYQRLEQRSMPLVFDMAEQLSDEQLAEFMAELYKEQEEYEEEYLSRTDEEVHERSYENLSENLADVLGRLQPDQKERLLEASALLRRFDRLWLEQRLWWLGQTETLLEREPGWQEQALDLMARREELESPEYQAVNEYNQQVIYAALADVLNARTGKQDARLRREIGDIRRDLLKLIEQGE
jgi:uncharacterized protein YutE (UPF0331/DUF86 family)